ncbi:response regulator [Sulfurimonas sp. SWIR-19]|uniref:response regulator n=1 Tax=Sulfurimonas sp. SWIR-19 TaxID=2878390 RepID=UPI001CF430DC|nr:response regulator [Sulfurimonas sp. SWIR-19]UCM99545.1 response regulator [Sulfurimonas sp. SWIR-19]
MVLQYQNELFALAAILLLMLIYFRIKQKNKTEADTKAAKKEEELKAEQSGQITVTPQKEIQEKKIQNTVPRHAKITKEDFKIFAGERILLAEDNLINQKVILGVLGDSGIEVVVANDGQEALDILQTDKNFLIILMDAHMPRVDGFEATRAIRHDPQNNHIPVIALSGDTASDDIRKMKEAGMDEHLEKPLQVDTLYDILYKYSAKISAQEDNSLDIPALDIQRGLQVCGNDTAFYHDILKEFLVTYSNSAEELEILLKNDKADQADSLLLDIIGVSANIGADALTACANDIKNNINANKNINLALYKKRVQELVQSINNYFLTCN